MPLLTYNDYGFQNLAVLWFKRTKQKSEAKDGKQWIMVGRFETPVFVSMESDCRPKRQCEHARRRLPRAASRPFSTRRWFASWLSWPTCSEPVVLVGEAGSTRGELSHVLVLEVPDSRSRLLSLDAPQPLVLLGGRDELHLWVRWRERQTFWSEWCVIVTADRLVVLNSSSESIPWRGRLGFHWREGSATASYFLDWDRFGWLFLSWDMVSHSIFKCSLFLACRLRHIFHNSLTMCTSSIFGGEPDIKVQIFSGYSSPWTNSEVKKTHVKSIENWLGG